jgi:type VI protein secretion system component VasF
MRRLRNVRPERAARSESRIHFPFLTLGSLAFVVVLGSSSFAQNAPQNPPSNEHATASDSKKPDPVPSPVAPASAPVDPAQAQLIADAEKLLRLSQELKAEVAKSNKDTLSLTVIKKADEVEKLAKSLRDRMNKAPKS